MKTTLVLLVVLAACGDSTGPKIRCEAEKRAFLTDRFGSSFSPTSELLRQDIINLGSATSGVPEKQAVFAADCSVAVRDTPP